MSDSALQPGLWTVLTTPFTDTLSAVDPESIAAQVAFHRSARTRGLVALGVFGESASLSAPERLEVINAVVSAGGDFPLVIGFPELTADAVVAAAVPLLSAAGDSLAALMIQVNSPDPELLRQHLQAIHDATGAALVVQDYPVASKVTISTPALISALAGLDFVAAVKSEAPPTSVAIAALSAALPAVPVFGGLGGIGLLDELQGGAAGAMTGFSHPEVIARTLLAWDGGGFEAALAVYGPWLPLVNFEAQPIVGLSIRKRVLTERGVLTSPGVRPPALSLPDALLPMLFRHLAARPTDTADLLAG
jgi:4-hydroxy-tetrahydrodipicolinate synthase